MTSFSYRSRFQAAILAFSAFNLLGDGEDRRACLDAIARHLEPGGLLLADLFNPGAPGTVTPLSPRRFEMSFRHPPHGHLVTKIVEERDNPDHGTMEVRYRYEERRDRDDSLVDELEVSFTLARLHRADVEGLLYGAGFDVEGMYGDYSGRPFTERNPRMIIQARRLSD